MDPEPEEKTGNTKKSTQITHLKGSRVRQIPIFLNTQVTEQFLDTTRISLIRGLKERKPESWETFFALYAKTIEKWANSVCFNHFGERSRQISEEVAQEVMAAIVKKVKSYELAKHRKRGFRKWLRKVTCTEVINYLRKNEKHCGAGGSGNLRFLEQQPALDKLKSDIDSEINNQFLEDARAALRAEEPEKCKIVDELGWGDGRAKDPDHLNAFELAEKYDMTPASLLKLKSDLKKRLKEIFEMLRREWE